MLVGGVAMGPFVSSALAALLAAVMGFIGVAISIKTWSTESHRAQLAAWDRAIDRLDDAYYCARDDVVFASDGRYAAPERFVQETFEPRTPTWPS